MAYSRSRCRRSWRSGALRSLALLFIASAGLVPQAAWAATSDSVYTVGNYPVEARAENAIAAKERALAEGQQAAFRSLLKRLVPVMAHARLRTLKIARTGDLIEGIRVRSERNSPTDYLASLDFSFQPAAVRQLLQREGLPFVDEQAPQVLLIPVWRPAAGAPLKDEASWTAAWKGLDLEHALAPAKLALPGEKVPVEAVTAVAGGNAAALRQLVSASGSELIVIALGEPEPASRKLNVTLTGRDAVGAFTLKRSYRLDPSDPSYAAELAGVVSMGILEGRWKAVAAGNSSEPQQPVAAPLRQPEAFRQPPPRPSLPGPAPVAAPAPSAAPAAGVPMQVAVQFQGMQEWQAISRKLAAVPGVQDLDVVGLSARGARVTLRYAGGPEGLAAALEEQGLALRNSGGAWVLSAQ